MTALPYTAAELRPHFEKMALHKVGVTLEQALQMEAVRVVLAGAMRVAAAGGRLRAA